MNIGALSMSGLGAYGNLPTFLQTPQGRDFESFLRPFESRLGDQPAAMDRFQPLSNNGSAGDRVRYTNPFRKSPVSSASGLYPQTSTSTSMEVGSLSLTQQSTELSIRTRDGDIVTIHLSEKEQSAAYLAVERLEGEETDGIQQTELAFQNAKAESSSFGLKAIFEENEVSDVSITAESASMEYTNLNMSSTDEGGQTEVQYRSIEATSSHLNFEVEGSLDQEELEAIGALLADVDALADEFFNGDVQKAFVQATQLGYDDSEIAGYAFKLTEQETHVVADRYQRNSGESGLPTSVTRPLSDYIERLERIQETANLYFEMEVLEVMMDRIAGTREHESRGEEEGPEASKRFRAFNERMLNAVLEWMA